MDKITYKFTIIFFFWKQNWVGKESENEWMNE